MKLPPELRFRAVGLAGHGLLAALDLTLRIRVEGEENLLRFRSEGTPVILVFWHGLLLPLIRRHRNQGIVVLVSEHADGEYITRILERHGCGTARGSSTRGGSKGLRALIRAAREGHTLGITPDGPRGPARQFKPGALLAARLTGLPIVPMAAAATSAWHLKSWDRFMIPRPGARVHIRYGPPRWIARDADEGVLEREARELEGVLEQLARAPASGAAVRPQTTEGP